MIMMMVMVMMINPTKTFLWQNESKTARGGSPWKYYIGIKINQTNRKKERKKKTSLFLSSPFWGGGGEGELLTDLY